MQLKRVRITASEVHDGLGGVHYKNQTPTLPVEITEIFVTRNMAVYEEDTRSPEEIKKAAADEQDRTRQAEQKGRAEAVMRRHDALPPDERIAGLQPEPEPERPVTRKRGRRREGKPDDETPL